MCPPGPSPSSDIGTYWTDEELIVFLVRIQQGSPLPSNVLADVNPFEYRPSNLPDNVWYFVNSESKKETEIGFWKAIGEGCQIYSDSEVTGWRTTLEFYNRQSDDEHRTNWVMQRYWITQKGSNNLKASGSLCRVFPCDGGCRKQKRQRHLVSDSAGGEKNPFPEEHNVCNSQNGPTNNSQGIIRHDETKSSDPAENQDDVDCFRRGDYLELLDLVNPRSSSSSSDNSSCVSMASDEVFDYLALLNDLETENSKENHSKSTSCNLSVSTSNRLNEVIVCPAIGGSLVSGDGSQLPIESAKVELSPRGLALDGKFNDTNARKHAAQNGNDALPSSHEVSTSQRSVSDKGKKITLGKMKMLRKKYLCFMPF